MFDILVITNMFFLLPIYYNKNKIIKISYGVVFITSMLYHITCEKYYEIDMIICFINRLVIIKYINFNYTRLLYFILYFLILGSGMLYKDIYNYSHPFCHLFGSLFAI